jgi:hypothetical protein
MVAQSNADDVQNTKYSVVSRLQNEATPTIATKHHNLKRNSPFFKPSSKQLDSTHWH